MDYPVCRILLTICLAASFGRAEVVFRDVRFYQRTGDQSRVTLRLHVPQTLRQPATLGDDPGFWADALKTDLFVTPGASLAESRTQAFVSMSKDTLYLAVDCYEADWDKLVTAAQPAEGDSKRAWADDSLEIFIDGDLDQKSYHWMVITAAGAKEDASAFAPERLKYQWNGTYAFDVRRHADKWRVEMAIPLAEVGIDTADPAAFGFNVVRNKLTPAAGISQLAPTHGPNHAPGHFAQIIPPGATAAKPVEALLKGDGLGKLILFKDEYPGGDVIATGHAAFNLSPADMADCTVLFELVQVENVLASTRVRHPQFNHVFFDIDIGDLAAGDYEVRATASRGNAFLGRLTANLVRHTGHPATVAQRHVDIIIDDAVAFRKQSVPLTVGIPMPRDTLAGTDNLRVVDLDGMPVPHQARVMTRWTKSGSIKWLGLDFIGQSRQGRRPAYRLEFGDAVPPARVGTMLIDRGGLLQIDNGVLRITIDKESGTLIQSVHCADREVAHDIDGRIIDNHDVEFRLSPARPAIRIEEDGPIKCVIRKEQPYVNADGRESCIQITRITVYRDQPWIQLTHTFVFTEDSNKTQLKDISIDVPLTVGELQSVAFDIMPGTADAPAVAGKDKLGAGVYLHQGKVRRYREGTSRFEVRCGDELLQTGERAGHWYAAHGDGVIAIAGVRNFWQQFPKELELITDGQPLMRLHLWSGRGGVPLDFRTDTWIARRGKWGEHFADHWRQQGNQAFGAARTHEVFLCFLENRPGAIHAPEVLAETFQKPVLAYCDPKWVTTSGVFGKFHYADRENFPREEAIIETVIGNIEKNFCEDVDYGFLDYGLSPRMEVVQVDGLDGWLPNSYRYNADYGFPQFLWQAFARDPRRDYLELAMRNTGFRTELGMSHAHGLGKHPGEFNFWGFPWPPSGQSNVGRNFTFHINQAILQYYLRGYNRGAEIAREYGERFKTNWDFDDWPEADPNINKQRRSRIACMRECIDLYQLTWDDSFLLMAREMFEAVSRPDEPGGFRPDTMYAGSDAMEKIVPIYSKHEYAIFDFSQYHGFTGDPEAQRSLHQQFEYYHKVYGYTWPFDNNGWWYNMPLAYWQTGDAKYAAYVHRMNELLIDYVNAEKNNPRALWRYNAAANAVVQGVGYIESVLAATRDTPLPLPYVSAGHKFYVQPPEAGPLTLDVNMAVPRFSGTMDLPVVGLGEGKRLSSDRISYRQFSNNGYGKNFVQFEIDLPAGTQEVVLEFPGVHGGDDMKPAKIYSTNARRIVCSIEGGGMVSRFVGDYWFFVPEGRRRFTFNGDDARKFVVTRPDGRELRFEGREKRPHTVTVPAGQDGRPWKFECRDMYGNGYNFIWLMGVPQVVSLFSPDGLFVPKLLSAVPGTTTRHDETARYVPGVSGAVDDQALNIRSGRRFRFPRGDKLDRMRFDNLDLNEGTIEWWFKPRSASFELGSGWLPWFCSSDTKSGLIMSAETDHGRSRCATEWRTKGGKTWYDTPRVVLRRDRWQHVALQWHRKEHLLFYDFYVDGRKMKISGGDTGDVRSHGAADLADPGEWLYLMSSPADRADKRLDARPFECFIDEVRISTGKRYNTRSFMPARRFDMDDRTLALFHFDGKATGIRKDGGSIEGRNEP